MIDFLLFVILAPFLVVGVILGMLIDVLRRNFNLPLVAVGFWFVYLGGYFAMHSTPEPSRQFVSLVESLAQSHVLGISTSLACLATGGALIAVAAFVKLLTVRGRK